MRKVVFVFGFVIAWLSGCFCVFAADDEPVAWWKFDEDNGRLTLDSASQIKDTVVGNFKYAEGVSKSGMRFNGFTTCVIRKFAEAPQLSEAFTIEAWIAPQEYPWNWCGIANQEKQGKAGYFFGIDAEGHIGLHVAVNGQWHECNSEIKVPLLRWSHIAGVFDKEMGINIYINGTRVGSVRVKGQVTPGVGQDLLLGRSLRKMCPAFTERAPSRKQLADMVFDGLIDEVKIHNRTLSAEEVSRAFAAIKLKNRQPLSWRVLPCGPKGTGKFGAYYSNLKYCEEWDSLWRGTGPDIVVTFDMAPIRLVSWRGISYALCWVTENGNWFSNEFMERGTSMGCGESMSDKQARYSHSKIIENTDARVVLFWRNSPVDILYRQPNADKQTDWGDWSEEYWIIYPDGVAVRKVLMWSSNKPFGWCEWSQSLPIFQPGQRPEDVLDENSFLSLADMAGDSQNYRWPPDKVELGGANIQIVNYKSQFKPFLILTKQNPRIWFAKVRKRKRGQEIHGMSMPLSSKFWWWNHWPVAQLANDGRVAEAADRPSSSYTSTQDSAPYETGENRVTKIMLCGLTDKSADELVPLAKSWVQAPKLELASEAFSSEGYDPTQRAYVLVCKDAGKAGKLEFTLASSQDSPVVNPGFVVKNWGQKDAGLKINGKEIRQGKNFRCGHHHRLEGSNLIVWVRVESTRPVEIAILPADM